MQALERRGHAVRELKLSEVANWEAMLGSCDALHVHRVCDDGVVELARAARAAGAAVVWDDDDDVTRPPKGIGGQGVATGRAGKRRRAARATLFREVDLVTTPSPALAEIFRHGGAPDVRVLENYVIDDFARERAPRGALRIGWVAGEEHRLDLAHIPVEDALQRLLDAHPHVHVTTIGIRLKLSGDRYEHVPIVPLPRLLRHVSTFSIGIAPLSPVTEINETRSNIKLKEYAAVGVPWLASPIGPYAGLGEGEGGRLVLDDRWFAELDALVRGERTRRRLAKRASRWGQRQLLSRNVGCWEREFERVVAHMRAAA
jgi:glycosyltransferase involved in cell wall biosynthesis